MLQPPRQPSRTGGAYEHIRQTSAHTQQRGSAMTGGMTTTKGFIPNRPKPQLLSASGTPVIAGALNMNYRGEWHSSLSYANQDVCAVGGGDNAGLYIATGPVAPGGAEPGIGGGFIKIAETFVQNVWK